MRRYLKYCTILLAAATGCGTARALDVEAAIKAGDAQDARMQNRQALMTYRAVEKEGKPNAELLRRIAKQYAELMADTDAPEQKRMLGDKALGYAKQAEAADPKDAMAVLSVAVCYGRLAPLMDNKTKIAYSREVKSYADRALALDPNNDLTYNVLGTWNYELAGLNPFLKGLAGMIYGKLPDASYAEAKKYFQKALELDPSRLANHIGLGRTLVAMGQVGEGKAEIEKGLGMPSREKDDAYVKNQGRETLQKI